MENAWIEHDPHLAHRQFTEKQAEKTVIIGGSTYPELTQNIAESIGTHETPVEHKRFANSELHSAIQETVRGKRVFIIQTDVQGEVELNGKQYNWSVNDSLAQTLVLVDAAARASGKKITVIKPNFGYARQDRKLQSREPVTAATHINCLKKAGMKHLVSVDLHSPQIGALIKRFDNLSATNRLAKEVSEYVDQESIDRERLVFIAPDEGSLKLPKYYQSRLATPRPPLVMEKTRHHDGVIREIERIEGVGGLVAVLVDDMIDTGGTIEGAVEILRNSGADKVIIAATHGIFSDPALDRFSKAEVDKLFVTNTVPQIKAENSLPEGRLHVVDIASLIGKAVFELATHGSISEMFENGTYAR